MAVKTFTTGEVLTAADTNTYLNNGGLVYITQTAFNTNGTVNTDGCFTSTYRNYRLIIQINSYGSASAGDIQFKLRAAGATTAANYSYDFDYTTAVAGNTHAYATAQGTGFCGWVANIAASNSVDLFNPQAAEETFWIVQGGGFGQTTSLFGRSLGAQTGTTQFDGFQIASNTGQTMAGTVYVYGYRMS